MRELKNRRLSEDIKRELTDIMRRLKDPRVQGLISIVKVDLSGDMSYCKVYVSSINGIESAKTAKKGLESASGFIRREIGQRLTMRKTPQFIFIADDSIAKSAEIARVLHDIMPEKSSSEEESDAQL